MPGNDPEHAAASREELRERLHGMGPERFARFVADVWSRVLGWETRVVGHPGERGVDILAEGGDDRQLVQAKRYGPGTTIDAPEVKQYASLRLEAEGVDRVAVVTTGEFSAAAREAAGRDDAILVDGAALLDLVTEYDAHELLAAHRGDAAPGELPAEAPPPADRRERLAEVLADDGPLARLRSVLGL